MGSLFTFGEKERKADLMLRASDAMHKQESEDPGEVRKIP
jgi:hypothetical protein